MFTLAISFLTMSYLPCFRDLTFQVPMHYCSLALNFAFTIRHIHNSTLFLLWPSLFILSEAMSLLSPNIILDTYQPGGLIFWCHIFLPFHTVQGILEARRLKWLAIPFSSGLCFVRTLHHDLSSLGSLTWLIAWLNYTRLWSMWSLLLAFCDCGFCSGGCGIVVLGSVVCFLMDENKWLVQASWWEEMDVGETWSFSGVTWGHLFS